MGASILAAGEGAAEVTSAFGTELVNVFSTAFTQIQSDVVLGIKTALPYGLAIAGTIMAVCICLRFFRSVAH